MFRWIIILLVVLLAACIVYFILGNTRPSNLGVTSDGKLLACPSSPNCVSSQADKNDKRHYIEPIAYTQDRTDAQLVLEKYLLTVKEVNIVANELGYIHVEATSDLMRYIDDVEFYLPKTEKVIHVRSASRVGYSDRGVNRARIEKIRADLLNL